MTESTYTGHIPGEATPKDVQTSKPAPPPLQLGLHDAGWTQEQWRDLVEKLVASDIASWKDITALVLGHMNPSQVGTSLASSDGFKRKYGKGNTMRIVMDWVIKQTGRCADCGARLELQADHIKGREQYSDPLEADFIENMTLRCRRCNVVRRPSHEFGGLTYLTAEAALMWILLVIRPRTYFDYVRMCRIYGMTMSDIRMEEAWAMAHWLARSSPPAFGIEDDAEGVYELLHWADGAITRADPGRPTPANATQIYPRVRGCDVLGFVAVGEDGRLKFFEQPLSFIPFSTYDLGERQPQALAIRYRPPDRKKGTNPRLDELAPRGMRTVVHGVRNTSQRFALVGHANDGAELQEPLAEAPNYGRLLNTQIIADGCRLRVQ